MPQGTRVRIGRVAVVGLGVALCSAVVGCMNTDPGPKKSQGQLPTKTGTVGPGGVNWQNQPPTGLGANSTRPVGGTPTGAQPGAATQFGQPQPGYGGSVGAPTKQGNPASFSPTAGGNTFVPSVGPSAAAPMSPSGIQPAGGVLPQPSMPTSYNSPYPVSPAGGISPQPVTMTAGYRSDAPSAPILDHPTPPQPPSFAPPVTPIQPVATPVAPAQPYRPIAPNFGP